MERRQIVLDNIRDNDEAGAHYREVCRYYFYGFCAFTDRMIMFELVRPSYSQLICNLHGA